MRGRNTVAVALAAVTIGVPPGLWAGGMRLASQDGFATARGEAFVATANNPSAIHYNPAGIAQLEGHHARFGLYGIHFNPGFTPPAPAGTNRFHLRRKLAAVPQLFYCWAPRECPLKFGLGVYSAYGLGGKWPQDTGFRAVAIEGSLTHVTINPVVALPLAPGLFLGAGVMANYAEMELEQGLLRYAQPLPNYFRFKGQGWSAGYNAGVLWQPHRAISLGAALRGSTPVTFDGKTEFQQYPVIPVTRRSATTKYSFPLSVVFGISYRPTPRWNLEFNADYTDWSSFETNTLEQAPPPWPVKQKIPVAFDWQPSWMYEAGLTRYLGARWHVSAGYVFSENSVPNATYTPLVADLDRHFISAGAGYRGRRYGVDVAYQFGFGPSRRVTGSAPPSTPARNAGQTADGTYDFTSHALLVTMGVRF
ncbi:MAG: outer membrane protein transport protein [Verrucomicrobia bacterium]|nr:outer membrane protein transport protein [Verrucomicrobiota bacterium]